MAFYGRLILQEVNVTSFAQRKLAKEGIIKKARSTGLSKEHTTFLFPME